MTSHVSTTEADTYDALRNARFVQQELLAHIKQCEQTKQKLEELLEKAIDESARQYLQTSIDKAQKRLQDARLGIEEIQMMKELKNYLNNAELRVHKYADELVAKEKENKFLMEELSRTREQLRQSDDRTVELTSQNNELLLCANLQELDTAHLGGPRISEFDGDSRLSLTFGGLEGLLSNLSTTARGRFADRTLPRDGDSEEKLAETSIAEPDENEQREKQPENDNDVSEEERIKNKRQIALARFHAGELDEAEMICKELLKKSHDHTVEARASSQNAEAMSQCCIWEVAEQNEVEKKSAADQSDEERAAILDNIDGKNHVVMSMLKVLSEIYRQKGRYLASDTLDDAFMRIRSKNPPRNVTKVSRPKGKHGGKKV